MENLMKKNTSKALAWLLILSMLLLLLPAAAFASDGAAAANETYVLMNIPYAEFYAAEVTDSDSLSAVDAISSATKSKPLSTLAAGSYHVNQDGTDITGIVYPVKVTSLSDLAGLTQVTDEDSISYTVTMRGKETTYTYEGKDALCGKPSYSYYVLSEAPAVYKVMSVKDGVRSFSAINAEAVAIEGASATLKQDDSHAEVAIKVRGVDGVVTDDNVKGVTLHTTDGTLEGLRHVYEIWHGTKLGFSVSGDNADHNALLGKTIDKITYYLNDGTVRYIATDIAVPDLANNKVLAKVSGENGTTYKPLFETITQGKYDQLWHDYIAAVAGDDENLVGTVQFVKTFCQGTEYGQAYADKVAASEDGSFQFCCKFINGAYRITVNGNNITVTDAEGAEISNHNYTYRGVVKVSGEMPGWGVQSYEGHLYMTTDKNAGEFKYFIFRDDNPEDTYHIEFVYGSDLTELQKYTAGKYAYWQGAGIPENADEKLIENCIKLYCVENAMSETRSAASIAQVADLVGTWDISLDDGKTADYSLQHFTVDKNGNGTMYENGAVSAKHQVFAYDNDGKDEQKSGVYVTFNGAEETLSWADYAITTSGNKTILTLTGDDENGETKTWTYLKHKSTSSSAGGGSSMDYVVSVANSDNGSVKASQSEASAGSFITITAVPKDGYKVGTVTVTYKNGNKVTVTNAGDNQYTFTMPDSNVTVKATFIKADGTTDSTKAVVMHIGSKTVAAYGKTINSDVAPLIINNRTMVPIRVVTETLGGTAEWNANAKTVTLAIDGKTIQMTIGVTLEKYGVAPIIIDGRTYVPIRFVAEELGATVDWNENAQEIVITK